MTKNTPQQQRVIDTLDAPLSVAAGAGSGKTYTLTQRIVEAFFSHDGRKPTLESIDQVLAITFTRKAALELKNRIKSQLVRRGLVEESLRVDDAWITTIHGMCSNLLKEHALEFGLDPAFELLEDSDAEMLFDAAANKVLARIRYGEEGERLRRLVDENAWGGAGSGGVGRRGGGHASGRGAAHARGGFSFAPSLLKDARKLLDKYRALPGGASAVKMAQPSTTPNALLRKMYEAGLEYRALVEGFSDTTATDEKHLSELVDALAKTEAYLGENPSDDFVAFDFDSERYINVLFAYPKTSPKYKGNAKSSANSHPEFFADYRQLYGDVLYEALACVGVGYQQGVFELAKLLDAAYREEKGARYLDQTDLLAKTAEALRDHPEVAREYRDRFRLVMVDEFQDTDRLQVAIVRALAAEDGSNICTVGDAQQSIYRFRGADVSVFFDVQKEMIERHGDCAVELPDNFRSHRDVLAFVEEVFSQPDVFGENFLRLRASGKINEAADPVFEKEPRIEVLTVEASGRGASATQAEPIAAREIAARFARLRDAGVSPNEMVILFRRMSNVGPYVSALQDAGFESLITGGSVFALQPEVQTVSSLCRWLANGFDSAALYQVLASDMCNISDTVLLALSRAGLCEWEDPTKFARGFFKWKADGQGEDAAEASRAQSFLREALRRTHVDGLVAGVRYVLVASGWLHRLEQLGADGVFQAGNIMKAVRILEHYESDGFGVSETASAFDAYLEGSKEKPGTLSSEASNYVRLMTIHASKGLEFGHVAVVLPDAGIKSGKFLAETVGDCCYVSARGDVGGAGDKDRNNRSTKLKELKGTRDEEDPRSSCTFNESDPAAFRSALERRFANDEREEARRLFYVAATRAVKSLQVVFPHVASATKIKEYGTSYVGCGVAEDVRNAFEWDETGQGFQQLFTCGGTTSVLYRNLIVPKDEEGGGADVEFEQQAFLVPTDMPLDRASMKPFAPDREGVFSYSSLPHDETALDGGDEREASSTSGKLAQALDGEAATGNLLEMSGKVANESLSGADGESAAEGLPETGDESATDLGIAFHRLAQLAILAAKRDGLSELTCPPESVIAAQVRSCGLSDGQEARLVEALHRWFGSECAQQFMGHGEIHAEMPFYVMIPNGEKACYLEGEIDAIAIDESGRAHIIDYKTGGSLDEDSDQIRTKHLLQAQCYAYALLRQGFEEVEATFVRVEQPDSSCPDEPQTVRYAFGSRDLQQLEETIMARWHMGNGTRN